jgi:hypothetical protein
MIAGDMTGQNVRLFISLSVRACFLSAVLI